MRSSVVGLVAATVFGLALGSSAQACPKGTKFFDYKKTAGCWYHPPPKVNGQPKNVKHSACSLIKKSQEESCWRIGSVHAGRGIWGKTIFCCAKNNR